MPMVAAGRLVVAVPVASVVSAISVMALGCRCERPGNVHLVVDGLRVEASASSSRTAAWPQATSAVPWARTGSRRGRGAGTE
ncbi:hypothetical protein [Streptomyces sp. NBC_01497]|uniref:hypothetical protein n=1 Tax=Streptomyces sp. NBC_01497 TaxID=2903885 RepID=UPI002E31C014|nr:hypothetical protein [Streptomyces sp. NBC_01497]